MTAACVFWRGLRRLRMHGLVAELAYVAIVMAPCVVAMLAVNQR